MLQEALMLLMQRCMILVWCEVQVEYGLLGKRYLKPSQRPTSFISSSGVEIKVNTHKAISRQNILDGGIKVSILPQFLFFFFFFWVLILIEPFFFLTGPH
jgi:hypothetical protein